MVDPVPWCDGEHPQRACGERNAFELAPAGAPHSPASLADGLPALPALVPARIPKRRSDRFCGTCDRDARGRIRRSAAVRRAFVRAHPCPATGETSGACPGWIVDHVVPLWRGGADAPENMQWLAREAARAKDRVE